ncbi:MAG: carboxypeptidase-like regulatory domain-containing protein [Candidatus Cloacimonetes bacterium]|nr:carboxypeptidase-like regulatory domain-containing protein [Candidatus Cloacimonadota bacterium]
MNKIKLIIIAALFVLLLTGCEDSATETVFDHNSSLEGYVTFEDNSPDTLSAMIIVSRNNLQLAETTTDSTGYYLLENLSSGTYFVSIDLTGFARSIFQIELVINEVAIADTMMLEVMGTMDMQTRIVDGEIDNDWEPAYSQDHVSGWGGNDFDSLYLSYDEDYLYVAVTGQFSTSDNTVCVGIDIDNSGDTGINDFSTVDGGDIGGRIRKNIDTPEDFGADIVFCSGWALEDAGVVSVSLDNHSQVDENMLEDVVISLNGSVLEFAISLEEIYGGAAHSSISLIAYIGGGGDIYFADDVIPQVTGAFDGTFYEVFTIGY